MKKSIKPPLGKKDPLLEKFHFFFIWFVRITLLIALFRALISENWYIFGIVLFALLLTFFAFIIEKRYKIDIPIEFEIGIVLLIYGSIFLGELRGQAFGRFILSLFIILPVYVFTTVWLPRKEDDQRDPLRFISVSDLYVPMLVIVGLVGFLVLLTLYRRKRVIAAPFSIALFSFSLAAAIGGIWEIFEFGMDQLFGLNMQKSGLMDTMFDIIVNDVGAFLSSLLGYFYLKGGEVPILSRIIRRFKKENPSIGKELS